METAIEGNIMPKKVDCLNYAQSVIPSPIYWSDERKAHQKILCSHDYDFFEFVVIKNCLFLQVEMARANEQKSIFADVTQLSYIASAYIDQNEIIISFWSNIMGCGRVAAFGFNWEKFFPIYDPEREDQSEIVFDQPEFFSKAHKNLRAVEAIQTDDNTEKAVSAITELFLSLEKAKVYLENLEKTTPEKQEQIAAFIEAKFKSLNIF